MNKQNQHEKILHFTFRADTVDEGHSAGESLRRHFACSASLVKQIRLHGSLLINGQPSRMKTPLHAGDQIEASGSEEAASSVLRAGHGIRLLYQDPWLLAVEKQAGEVVHPSLNPALPDLCSRLSEDALHPVNRLDRDTSGLVLIALNGHTHYRLSRSPIDKRYLALAWGKFPGTQGSITYPISRDASSLMLRRIDSEGKASRTDWKLLRYFEKSGISLLEFRLFSGRTHQIRVHALALGNPLLGDSLYGRRTLAAALAEGRVAEEGRETAEALLSWSADAQALETQMGRQALHAAWLAFEPPLKKRRIAVYDPPTADLAAMLQELERRETHSVP